MHLALQACLAAVILAGTCYLVSLDSGYSVQSKFMSDSIDVPLTHKEPPTTGTVGQNPSPRGTNHPKDPRKEPGTSQPKNKTEPSPSETPQKNETGPSPPETTHEQPQTETPSENPTENTETPSQSGGSSTEGEDIDEGSLKSYPPAGSAKSPIHSQRKDQRKISLCRITGENCQRFRPVEELPTFWLICVLYAADQQATELLYQHHRDFVNYAKLFGFRTQAIEVIFPGQEYKITEPNKQPEELQYKADWIFNMRENLVNVGAKKLPDDWQYIAWIDAHIFWDENRYFFEDVVVELNKNNIVHMLGSNDFYDGRNVSNFHEEGFAKLWHQMHTSYLPPIRQCGMAWATRRDVFERNGGVLDVCIGTKCDLYQNYPMIGETYTGECSNPEYANAVRSWQQNAIKVFDKKVGYVKGNIVHFQHCIGKCKTSSYDLMTSALMQYNFNPNTDMVRDEEGRMQFKSNWGLAKRLWEIYGGAPRN